MKPKWTLWCQAIPSGKSTSRPAWKFHQFHDGKGWKGEVSFHPDVLHGWRVSSLGANLLIFLGLHSHCFRLVLAHMNKYIHSVYVYIYIHHICCFSPRIGSGPFFKALPQACRMAVESSTASFWSHLGNSIYHWLKNHVFSFGICHNNMIGILNLVNKIVVNTGSLSIVFSES